MRCANFCVVNSRRDLHLVPGILAALVKADAIDAFTQLTERRDTEFRDSDIVDALVHACTICSLPNRYRFLERLASIKSGDLNIRYGMRETCLHLLAHSGAEIRCFDLVEELGVDRFSHTTYGENVMDLAAKAGHFELCMELARRGYHMTCIGYLLSPEDPRWYERRVSITLLRHVLPRVSDINNVGRLRGSDLDLNPVEPFVYYGDTEVLDFLISRGLDVEICGTSHRYGAPVSNLPLFNCLHLAVLASRDTTVSNFGMHERVVNYLVDTHPLLLEVPTGFGCYPHALSKSSRFLQYMWPSLEIPSRTLQEILTPPRGLNEYTSDALVKLAMVLDPALMDAIFIGDTILGMPGAEINEVFENHTALTMCAERGRLASCMSLIGHGAIAESDALPSALISAAKSGNTRLAALLIEQGARINRVDLHRLGNGPATALQSARSVRSRVMERFLLSKGAVRVGDSREIQSRKRKFSDVISGAFTQASRLFKRLFH
jgi:ankyrin repeat protein